MTRWHDVDDDEAELAALARQTARAGAHLDRVQRRRLVDEDLGVVHLLDRVRQARPVLVGQLAGTQAVLVERRPASGLLGGTLGFPTTGWDGSDLPAPFAADWQDGGEVRHVFTHFDLRLRILTAPLPDGRGTPRRDFDPQALPGLMRKVWALVSARSL